MSFDEEDDDDDTKFISKIITKQTNRAGNVANPDQKQMSYHPKELVRGTPTITEEESKSITDLKELQKAQAIFRRKNKVQGYAIDEIKAEGNKLIIDEDKVNERKKHQDELIKNMYEEEKKASKGVKHTIQGKTFMLGGN